MPSFHVSNSSLLILCKRSKWIGQDCIALKSLKYNILLVEIIILIGIKLHAEMQNHVQKRWGIRSLLFSTKTCVSPTNPSWFSLILFFFIHCHGLALFLPKVLSVCAMISCRDTQSFRQRSSNDEEKMVEVQGVRNDQGFKKNSLQRESLISNIIPNMW